MEDYTGRIEAKMKRKARKKSDQPEGTFTQFKKTVEVKLGKINWKKVGRYTLALLLVVAYMGLLGPKARLLSKVILKGALVA